MAKDFPSGGCNGRLPTGQRCGAVVGIIVGSKRTGGETLLLTSAAVAVHRPLFSSRQVQCICGKMWTWTGKIHG